MAAGTSYRWSRANGRACCCCCSVFFGGGGGGETISPYLTRLSQDLPCNGGRHSNFGRIELCIIFCLALLCLFCFSGGGRGFKHSQVIIHISTGLRRRRSYDQPAGILRRLFPDVCLISFLSHRLPTRLPWKMAWRRTPRRRRPGSPPLEPPSIHPRPRTLHQ